MSTYLSILLADGISMVNPWFLLAACFSEVQPCNLACSGLGYNSIHGIIRIAILTAIWLTEKIKKYLTCPNDFFLVLQSQKPIFKTCYLFASHSFLMVPIQTPRENWICSRECKISIKTKKILNNFGNFQNFIHCKI